jgi:hypothetical protein
MTGWRVWTLVTIGLLCAGCLLGDSHFGIDLNGGSTPGDPRIALPGTCCSENVFSTSFDLLPSTTPLGGGLFDLNNASGQDWYNLDFVATFPGITLNTEEFQVCPGTYSDNVCTFEGGPFTSFSINILNGGDTVEILFFGGAGITTAPLFDDAPQTFVPTIFQEIQTFTPTTPGAGGWSENGAPVTIHVQANLGSVPEPSTVVLLLSVAGILAVRRKIKNGFGRTS